MLPDFSSIFVPPFPSSVPRRGGANNFFVINSYTVFFALSHNISKKTYDFVLQRFIYEIAYHTTDVKTRVYLIADNCGLAVS